MGITAKELAKRLNLSEMAVSMALRNKPGVSTATRVRVISEAEKLGYDFSRIASKNEKNNLIYCVIYKEHNAILSYTPIFSELIDGIEQECLRQGYRMKIQQISDQPNAVEDLIEDIRMAECAGVILLCTEMPKHVCSRFSELSIPLILLDSSFESVDISSVVINNIQGAYMATRYLIERTGKQPGHLASSYKIPNFDKRRRGFRMAVEEHGMAIGNSITHELPPSIQGAFTDMLEIINSGEILAQAYFADNDLIAIGAIKALLNSGYRVPEDIAVIGFDNISEGKILDPSLTTMNIPRIYMGSMAAALMIRQIRIPVPHTFKMEISASLVKRFSV